MAQSPKRSAKRAGMPAPGSIVSIKTLRPVRPRRAGLAPRRGRGAYRILRTNEVDPKDDPMPKTAVPVFGAPLAAAPLGDSFKGTSRKAAKLSVADAPLESFDDLRSLIESLPSKETMKKHKPKITTGPGSDRVETEKRNIRLDAFLYAASREDDQDFHLIIGRARTKTLHMYMTVEISGLPPKGKPSFAKLKRARNAYKVFFGEDLPGSSYDFYDPPIPVEIRGSLFFDMSHATGQGPGPKSLRKDIPTVWEIHPVTKIVFEP